MDDRSIPVPRWAVIRGCESSRFQTQLLAQAYRRVFPEVRQSLNDVKVAARPCGSAARHSTAAGVAAGA
jgi:hypothetical protein